MPAHHPDTRDANRHLAGMPILPLRQTSKVSVRGVAPETNGEDIVDEILGLFKANIFFKNYNINTGEDRVLVYLTLYIIECLKKIQKSPSKERSSQEMYNFAIEPFSIPGDAKFPLNSFCNQPKKSEEDELRQYMTQLRLETGSRLVERVYAPGLSQNDQPSKWWTCFSKRKFLNLSLASK